MENEQPTQPQMSQPDTPESQPTQASSQPVPPAEPSVTPSGLTTPAQPVTESMVKTRTEQQTSSPLSPNLSGETPKPPKSGMLKWVGIGAGILVVAGTAAGLYFSGVFNPAGQNADQLKGAAERLSSQETAPAETQQEQETQQLTAITQAALNTCPVGQVMDPVSNRCACDINNNYFSVNIAGAYASPTAGVEAQSCTTCAALSDRILELAKSADPADAELKTQLGTLAKENNCSPCAVFDDRIAQAQQDKDWEKYFDLVVEKSNDKTCGRTLTACDSLKWQLLFLNDLRDKAGKERTAPEELEKLRQKQLSLEEDLGTNTTCYQMENLCKDLKTIYGTTQTAVPKSTGASGIGSAPLLGQTSAESGSTELLQPSTQQTQETGGTQQEVTPDLNAITLDQMFDKDFYLMHCPVDGQQTQQASASAPVPQETQQQAPAKVSRTKKQSAGTEQSGDTSVQSSSVAPSADTKASASGPTPASPAPEPALAPVPALAPMSMPAIAPAPATSSTPALPSSTQPPFPVTETSQTTTSETLPSGTVSKPKPPQMTMPTNNQNITSPDGLKIPGAK